MFTALLQEKGRGKERMQPATSASHQGLTTCPCPAQLAFGVPTGLQQVQQLITAELEIPLSFSGWSSKTGGKHMCLMCGQEGHLKNECTLMECSWADVFIGAQVGGGIKKGLMIEVGVNGVKKQALIDTGCSCTLVWTWPGEKTKDTLMVRCIHGYLKPYSTAWAWVQVGNEERKLKVGIVPELIPEMLLGRNWEGLEHLIQWRERIQVGLCEAEKTGYLEDVTPEQIHLWQYLLNPGTTNSPAWRSNTTWKKPGLN